MRSPNQELAYWHNTLSKLLSDYKEGGQCVDSFWDLLLLLCSVKRSRYRIIMSHVMLGGMWLMSIDGIPGHIRGKCAPVNPDTMTSSPTWHCFVFTSQLFWPSQPLRLGIMKPEHCLRLNYCSSASQDLSFTSFRTFIFKGVKWLNQLLTFWRSSVRMWILHF